jgi:hypothetical protein
MARLRAMDNLRETCSQRCADDALTSSGETGVI